MCGNCSREETIQGRKLYEEIRYVFSKVPGLGVLGPGINDMKHSSTSVKVI